MYHADMIRIATPAREMYFRDGKRISRKAWLDIESATLTKGAMWTRTHGNGFKHGHIAILPGSRA